jgi:hypothetical protein
MLKSTTKAFKDKLPGFGPSTVSDCGPPAWLVGRNQRPSMTNSEAHVIGQDILATLKDAPPSPKTHHAIKRLSKCRPFSRCLSPACVKCSRAFQRLGVAAGVEFIEDLDCWWDTSVGWSAMSMIPTNLGTTKPRAILDAVSEALRDAGVSIFVGGIDFSYNEDGRKDIPVAHVWGFAPEFLVTDDAKSQIKEALGGADRALWVKRYDRNPAGLAYSWKPQFCRRVSIASTRNGHPSAMADTKKRALRVRQLVHLFSNLNTVTLLDRLVLVGVEVAALPGKLKFMLKSSPMPPNAGDGDGIRLLEKIAAQ